MLASITRRCLPLPSGSATPAASSQLSSYQPCSGGGPQVMTGGPHAAPAAGGGP